MRRVITVCVDRCLGCKSCEIACAVAHSAAKNLQAALAGGEKLVYRVNVEACHGKAVPIHCNHCEDAPCVASCPTGAVRRLEERGIVLVDATRCIGCRMCVQACPFGVMVMAPAGKAVLKCDLCVERLDKGQEPACVEGCPTKALVFGEEQEASRKKRRMTAERIASGTAREAHSA